MSRYEKVRKVPPEVALVSIQEESLDLRPEEVPEDDDLDKQAEQSGKRGSEDGHQTQQSTDHCEDHSDVPDDVPSLHETDTDEKGNQTCDESSAGQYSSDVQSLDGGTDECEESTYESKSSQKDVQQSKNRDQDWARFTARH